jgi:site-specific DNA recombinase
MVVAYKTDRLSRGGGPGWAPLLEAIEGAGLNVDRAVATPSGFVSEFEIGIRAAMDREESKKLSERLLDVAGRRAAAGLRSGGGSRAYGFELDQMTLRESEVVVIKEIVRRVIAGHSYTEVAYWLNEQQIPTALGNQWIGLSVRNLLHRSHIAGIRSYNAVDYPAQWPAIIDKETWERLQLEMKLRRERSKNKGGHARYLLTPLVYCGNCGHMLSGDKRPDRHGDIKRFYACRGCFRVMRLAEPLEDWIIRSTFYRLDTPDLAKLLSEQSDDKQLAELLNRRGLQVLRIKDLDELFGGNEMPRESYVRASQAARTTLHDIDSEIAGLTAHSTIRIDVGQTLQSSWDANPISWRRALLQLVIKQVVVQKAKTYPKYKVGDTIYKFDPKWIEIIWSC